VTDAIAAAGCDPGTYMIGGVRTELAADGRVSLAGTPYLAGSSLTLDRAVANTARFTGLPLEDIAPMASTIPAHFIGAAPSGRVVADWDPATSDLHIVRVAA